MTPTPNDLAADLGRPAVAPAAARVLDAPTPWRLCEDTADGRTLEALAVPYSTPTRIGSYLEEIAPGSVDVDKLAGIPLLYRHDEPIGRIVEARDTADGPLIRARLSDTALGRDALTLITDGAIGGVSIGFDSTERDTSTPTRVRHTAIEIREISVTPLPAYPTAKITALREEPTVTTTDRATAPAPEAAPAPAAAITATETDPTLVREILDRVRTLETSTSPTAHPLGAYRSLTDYARAVLAGTETRALVDQITANNPGVVPPAWVKDVAGIMAASRPSIEVSGGAGSLPSSGMSLDWPYYDGDLSTLVGIQSAEKTEITSARVDLKRGTSPIKTYAGGSDLSLQLIQRSDPSYVDAYLRIMLAAYAKITNAAFISACLDDGTAEDFIDPADGAEVRAWIVAQSAAVTAATGRPPTGVALGLVPYLSLSAVGVPATTFALDVALPPIVHDPALGTDGALILNRSGAVWHEDGPHSISDDVVSKLGRDVAVYGFAAPAVYSPTGVIYSTPTAP